jgi:Domain of Unknown Function (DUF1080)
MNRRELLIAFTTAGVPVLGLTAPTLAQDRDETDWAFVPAPKGALILFDGADLSKWVNRRGGGPAGWKVQDGYMEVAPRNGDIHTRDTFTDYQLHVEFWLPYMPQARGQARANSGVYNQGRVEVQVLDSYGQPPRDNEAGGIYRVATPIRNASKKPEKWQAYDIAYRAPRFGTGGKQSERGRITVFHNGVMIHNNVEFDGMVTTSGVEGDPSKPGPILLQDHGNRVRYRNIWIIPVG